MRVVHIGLSAAAGAPANPAYAVSRLTRVLMMINRALCSVRGHVMVRHFEPGRLSLKCLTCGAQTAGWTIDVRPSLRIAWPAPPAVHRHRANGDARTRMHAA